MEPLRVHVSFFSRNVSNLMSGAKEWTLLYVNYVIKGQFYKGIIGK